MIFASLARTTVRRRPCPRAAKQSSGIFSPSSQGGTSTRCRRSCWSPVSSSSSRTDGSGPPIRGGSPSMAGALVRIVALIHLSLGLHGAIRLVQELLTMRVMGVTESFANFVVELISVIVNPLLAIGFWRARPMARYWAIAWYVFLSAIAVFVAHWYWRYHVPVEPRSWPNHLAGKVMPLFLLVVMFLPRVKRVFARRKSPALCIVGRARHGRATPAPLGAGPLSRSSPAVSDRGCLKPCRRYRGLDRTVGRGVETNRGILT